MIKVNALTKVFDNEVKEVDGISFTVEEDVFLGFRRVNGTGRTITLNIWGLYWLLG